MKSIIRNFGTKLELVGIGAALLSNLKPKSSTYIAKKFIKFD